MKGINMVETEHIRERFKHLVENVSFDCGKGWNSILYKLLENVENYNNMHSTNKITIDQIKEKFGGLRFYITGGDRRIDKLIMAAEEESMETCELCGAPGRRSSYRGWIATKCDSCYKIELNRRKARDLL